MKKWAAMLLSVLMIFAFTACSNNQQQVQSSTEPFTDSSQSVNEAAIENPETIPADSETVSNTGSKELDESYSAGFDYENRTVTLNNGNKMPILGLGTFMLTLEEAENSTYWALGSGFRLIDTADAYGNEAGVGRGLQRAIDDGIITREEVFITTKLWPQDYSNADEAINERLDELGVEYIDLLLLHQAFGDYKAAYQAMEKAVADGRVRSIGLSNFYEETFDDVMSFAEIIPAVLQNEMNPTYQQIVMREHIKEYGTRIMAWFPLGGRGHTKEMFNNPTIAAIAEAHGKSPAQVVLRWHMQVGSIAIPGSSNADHIQENFEIFDFELTEEEMEQMRQLETGVGTYNFSNDESNRFTGDSDWVSDRAGDN